MPIIITNVFMTTSTSSLEISCSSCSVQLFGAENGAERTTPKLAPVHVIALKPPSKHSVMPALSKKVAKVLVYRSLETPQSTVGPVIVSCSTPEGCAGGMEESAGGDGCGGAGGGGERGC